MMRLDPKVLENAWVRLEPLQEAHREPLRPVADDPGIWTHMSRRGDGPYFDAWFDLMLEGQEKDGQISHAVFDAQSGACVGHTSFLSVAPAQKRLEIGWTFYADAARGTAINPSCKLLLMTRAFDAGAERVELKTGGNNLRSQRAIAKLGLTKEGTLRSHIIMWDGTRRDSVYFSLLKDEWPGVKAKLTARLDAFD